MSTVACVWVRTAKSGTGDSAHQEVGFTPFLQQRRQKSLPPYRMDASGLKSRSVDGLYAPEVRLRYS